MKITPIHTRIMRPPQDDLRSALSVELPSLEECSVVAVTSKVVSIDQGRCVSAADADRDELIKQEAERYLERDEVPNGWVMHTIKHNLLISSAGIDHSNGDGYYVLWPEHPNDAAAALRSWLRRQYGVENVGVIITDSRSMPLRRGAIGVSLGYAGFRALGDYRGEKDLFGDELKVSMANLVDGLAAGATVAMGEGSEATPAAVVSDLPEWYFEDWDAEPTRPYSSLEVPPEEDMYYPLMQHLNWKKGGSRE